MIEKKHKIFHEPECISEEMMLRYVKSELSPKEKHKVEKHVLDCALCSDALEGLMMIEDNSRIKPIIENINQKILTIKPQTKVIWMDTRVRVAIAAGLAILVVSVFYFKNELQDKGSGINTSENLSPKEEQKFSLNEQLDSTVKNDPQKPGEDVKDEKTVAENKPEALKSFILESFKENEQGAPPPTDTRSENFGFVSTEGDVDATVKTGDKLAETKNEKSEEDKKNVNDNKDMNIVTTTSGNVTSTTETTVTTSTYQWNTNTEPIKKGKEDSGKKNKSKNDEAPKKEQDEEKTKQPKQSVQNDSYSLPKPEQKITQLDDLEKQGNGDTLKLFAKDSVSYVNYNFQAKKKFDSKDYSGAAMLYEQTLVGSPNNFDALLYSAQCYIELNKTEEAINKLDKMIAMGGKDNIEAGKYYKALALLKKNDKEGAKKLLSEVIISGGKYKIDAEKKLNSVK